MQCSHTHHAHVCLTPQPQVVSVRRPVQHRHTRQYVPAVSCAAQEPGPVQQDELPEALQGLSINDQGLLVDEKSGKVVNSLGATRWDVAVSAMRGLLDPPAWVENTEHTPGLILGSLVQFPTKYCFSVVGAKSPELRQDVVQIIERVCQVQVDPMDVKEVERLGGKYLSLQVDAMVRAPEVVAMVMEELGKDSRIKMKY